MGPIVIYYHVNSIEDLVPINPDAINITKTIIITRFCMNTELVAMTGKPLLQSRGGQPVFH